MRDRYARLGFLSLILALPGLIDAFADRRDAPRGAAPPRMVALASAGSFRLHGTQAVLLAGLTFAGRERLRLRAILEARPA